MDEGFTASAYPDVHKNLKLTVDEQVIPEEPVSSTGTLSSLQHLAKDFSFGDQFLNDKPSEADNEKTKADTEAESMVSVTVQQDTSVIPHMMSPVIGPVPRHEGNSAPTHDFIRRDECEHFDDDKAQEETKKKSKQDSLKPLPGSPPSPPHPHPPPLGASGPFGTPR
ncbi:hypothetical protein Tco_0197205, partial [Tanacetum coccineum]